MASPLQYLLTVGPIGVYLGILGYWQSRRHPRVVRGSIDFGLLAMAIGGLLAFGPLGDLAASILSGRTASAPVDRLIVVTLLGLWGCLLARNAVHRLVVYRVDADGLTRALEEVLGHLDGRFVRTLSGYEDRSSPRGVRVEMTSRLRCAVVEAYGRDPEGLIRQIRPRLRRQLEGLRLPPSRVAPLLYAGSLLALVLPAAVTRMTQEQALEILRALLRTQH
jgi:hypothetical protein